MNIQLTNENDDLYRRLSHHLDDLPGGFPSTPDGLELRILRRLFDPEEAYLAVHLSLLPESPEVIAKRVGQSEQEISKRLETMANKGLIYRHQEGEGAPLYMALQFVVGIWEYQLNNLSRELVEDVDEYFHSFWDFEVWKKAPQLRTIPVMESLPTSNDALTHEQAVVLVETAQRFAVADCICRKERRLVGEGCDKPLEMCLTFDSGADFYIRNHLGREIDRQEALRILHLADEAGLVLQPSNARKPVSICCCCGDCCGVLRNLRRQPRPADLVASPYIAYHDPVICSGCGDCLERCQMEALTMGDGVAILDIMKCIGCGLCVSTCPTGALTLQRKPEADQHYVPRNIVEAQLRLRRERGKDRSSVRRKYTDQDTST